MILSSLFQQVTQWQRLSRAATVMWMLSPQRTICGRSGCVEAACVRGRWASADRPCCGVCHADCSSVIISGTPQGLMLHYLNNHSRQTDLRRHAGQTPPHTPPPSKKWPSGAEPQEGCGQRRNCCSLHDVRMTEAFFFLSFWLVCCRLSEWLWLLARWPAFLFFGCPSFRTWCNLCCVSSLLLKWPTLLSAAPYLLSELNFS